jgi:hypothetical protein
MKTAIALLLLAGMGAPAVSAQSAPDYTTVDGIMTELYASVTRRPGEPFAWEKLRAIMLPGGIMLPQRQQTQAQSRIMNVDDFIAWIDTGWKPIIGTPQDQGFFERQTNLIVEEFGAIAHAFTTYEKGPWEPRRVQARGINSVQLVKRDGRWFILSITWDEENSGGPLPPKYRGS